MLYLFPTNTAATLRQVEALSFAPKMKFSRRPIKEVAIPESTATEINTALNAIHTLTYDPNLRKLLTDIELERSQIEERLVAVEQEEPTSLYKVTLVRMELKQNRKVQQELAGLAEVEQMGWTNDNRRRNVDIACSKEAATGYAIDKPRRNNGPSSRKSTVASIFTEVKWEEKGTSCCDSGCPACQPVSPGAGPSERWAQRVAQRSQARSA